MQPDSQMKVDKYFRQCVGIDVAKDTFTACMSMLDIASDAGQSSDTKEFTNNKHGFNQLVKWARKEAVKEVKPSFLMEVTGVYHENLAYHLHKLGFTVYVVVSSRARKYAEYEGIKTKTDAMDAFCLSRFGCVAHNLVPWEPTKPIYRSMRMLTRFIAHLNQSRTTLMNQLHALNHAFDSDKMLEKMYMDLIEKIDQSIEKTEDELEKLIEKDKDLKDRINNVCTISGVRTKTVATIVAETSGFQYVTNLKQLTSYAGLDVIAKQSGPYDPRHHISKKGNTYIRAALYMPALTASRYNKQISALYTRVKEKNPNQKMIAVTAAMRKLLLQIYTIWKKNEKYDPQK